ncbi:MAG: acyltransferase [Planctomycetota bacterium]
MRPTQYIPELDGVRAIAVLLVLWTHVPEGTIGAAADSWRLLLNTGYMGVDIFFVLSGFLITRILLVDREKGLPLRYFLVRRFLRIFPIYYLTLGVIAVVRGGPELPWCFAYLANFYFPFHEHASPVQHTWSLAVEEHFYLVWPFIVHLLPYRRSLLAILLGIMPMAFLSCVVAIKTLDPPVALQFVYAGSMFRALSLGFGALLAYAESWFRAKRQRPLGVALVCLVLWIILFVFVQWFPRLFHPWREWYPLTRLFAFGSLSMAVLLTCLGITGTSWGLLFRNRPFVYTGRISYGLYLYHYPIFTALGLTQGKPLQHATLWVMLALASTFLVASLSFYALERPILKFGSRFRAR